jgi:hypothetical protein
MIKKKNDQRVGVIRAGTNDTYRCRMGGQRVNIKLRPDEPRFRLNAPKLPPGQRSVRHFHRAGPDIVAGQVDERSTQWRQTGQGASSMIYVLGLQFRNGLFSGFRAYPETNGRHAEIEAGCALLLIFIGPISYFAQTVQDHGTRQAGPGLTFIEFLGRLTARLGLFQPVKGKQGTFQPPKLTKYNGRINIRVATDQARHISYILM